MSTTDPLPQPVSSAPVAPATGDHLPDDVATLKHMILELLARLQEEQRDKQALRNRIEQLLQRLYGKKTERFDPHQLNLFGDQPQAADPLAPDPIQPPFPEIPTQPKKKARPHGRRRLPADLERQVVDYELTDAERCCQQCGHLRIDIGFDPSEQLDYRPASLFVIEHRVHKYCCPCCEPGSASTSDPVLTLATLPPENQHNAGAVATAALSEGLDGTAANVNASAGVEPTPLATPLPAGALPPEPLAQPHTPEPLLAATVTVGNALDQALPILVSPSTIVVVNSVEIVPTTPPFQRFIAAPKPTMPIPKGLPGSGLLAHLIVSKYVDHLPLYRLERVYQRQGLLLPRSTTCDWLAASAQLLRPLYKAMVTFVLQSCVLHTDDTPVKTQVLPSRELVLGRLWGYLGDDAHPCNVFDFTLTRKRDGPQTFLEDYQGYLQADAFSGYDALYLPERKDGLSLIFEVACNAHARRRFYEARSTDLLKSSTALAYFGQLYEIERQAKDYEDARRLQIRQDLAVPILTRFKAWLDAAHLEALPKSPLGQAISYTLNQWTALCRYTESAILSIDNNVAEREMKRIAIGRKNWLFFGSGKGGETAAIMYSMVSSCYRVGVEPWAYLRDVLGRLRTTAPEDLAALMPHRWEATRLATLALPSPPAPAPAPTAAGDTSTSSPQADQP